MKTLADILVAFVALQHAVFLVLEMFLWTKPLGLKTFRMTREAAEASAVLAKNQGLYNGFLAAGLVWGLLSADPFAVSIKIFFLSCVAVAGVFGGLTAHPSIAVIQALPAVAAFVLILLS